ncbi:hypothetical protein GGR50DRAFT_691959 [Xylaria sp. CBS 124048]|nr:hypothetical protein GGR50DRAFT_691959 [Xylaria sp. CBS 124048]
MAKSARASSRKVNNQRLKAKVFGPVETARNARLSAKLLELAAAPKPERPEGEAMRIVEDENEDAKAKTEAVADEDSMDIDVAKSAAAAKSSKSSSNKKGRIEKRKRPSKIVFPKYGDKAKKKRKN